MRSQFRASLLPLALVVIGLSGASFYEFFTPDGEPTPGTEPVSVGTPHRDGPLPFVGGSPTLTAGFQDWALCELGGRVESRPPLFGIMRWGPATLGSLGSGCAPCGGGGGGYSGDPFSAALGLQLAPPHDIPMGDMGALPPSPTDHPFVMAGTGEVNYTEVDFVIPGIGFDLTWYRTYRSAYEFEGWSGYGWSHCVELYLVEHDQTTGDVSAYLGQGRVNDIYDWDSGTSSYISPDGYWDQLTKGTRPSNYPDYPSLPFFTKTEKNGVVWEFDKIYSTQGKLMYGCTRIADPFGNELRLEYNDAATDLKAYQVLKLIDTEGREVDFTYTNDLLTRLVVSDSSIHSDYGDLTIDYEYSGGLLTKATKHKTRQVDGGTVVRPYTEYTYLTSGIYNKDLNLVKDCGTTVLDFDYSTYGTTRDRCTKVTNADGEEYNYLHEQSGTPTYSKYTDPSNQRRDFCHADSANGDYFIVKVKEYLENELGNDISGSSDLVITRNCDCGQITELQFQDGSKEKWSYDANGNITLYTRTATDSSADLVKKWTYDSFSGRSRLLTSSGEAQASSSPSARVTWTWNNTTGLLEKVAWPSVTSGQPSSQTIEWEYTFFSDGKLKQVYDPENHETLYSYSGDNITISVDPGSLARVQTINRDLMGNVKYTSNAIGTEDTFTVAPDGRVFTVASSNSRERKYEYDLRGRRTKSSLLLDTSLWVHTTYTVSDGGVVTQTKEDDGGINAISAYAIEEGESNRYSQSLDADEYGGRSKWGYGSHALPWKVYNVDDSGTSAVVTLVETMERNTMGRVTKRIGEDGRVVEYLYDGYGRLSQVIEPLPGSKTRVTTFTLNNWGGATTVKIEESTSLLQETINSYDQVLRLYQVEQDDPLSSTDLITKYQRDPLGRVIKTTDPRNQEWFTEWDASGRITESTDPIGNEVQYAYSDLARTRTITHHEKNTSTSSFTDYLVVETMDTSGRVTSVKDQGSASGNRTTTLVYDKGSRVTQSTDPLGAVTDFEYDRLGRLTKTTQDIATSPSTVRAATSYAVTKAGNLSTATDASSAGVVTKWVYDSYGRILEVRYDHGGTTPAVYGYGYNDGRLETVTEPLGNYVTLTYDDGGRMSQVDVTKGSSSLGGPDRLIYTYDSMNRVLSGKTQQNTGGTYSDLTSVSRTYDGFGRLDTETQDGGFVLDYDYDAGGAVTKIDYPSGSPIDFLEYTMDDGGRLLSVARKLTSAVDGYSASLQTCAEIKYLGQREIERLQAPYDLKRTQTWTNFKEPANLEYTKYSNAALLTGLANLWNAGSQMVVRERLHDDVGGSDYGEVFRYDLMGRLTTMWYGVRSPSGFSASNPAEGTNPYDQLRTYTLGKVFERDKTTTKPDGGSAVDVEYSNNVFYQYDPIGGVNLDWDANGQLTDFGSDGFSWTALGQLAQVAISGGSTLGYTYDAFGRRVKTVSGSQVNRFLYHGWHMIGEYDDTEDEWLWQEIPWNTGERMLEHIALDATTYKQFAVHEDFQSTVWGISNTSGAMQEWYNYTDPFGVSDSENSSGTGIGDYASGWHHKKRLHGGFVEAESGLYDFRMRWNDPVGGYWISRDSAGSVDSNNLHQALLAGPLTLTDTFGLEVGGKGISPQEFPNPRPTDPRPPLYSMTDPCQDALDAAARDKKQCHEAYDVAAGNARAALENAQWKVKKEKTKHVVTCVAAMGAIITVTVATAGAGTLPALCAIGGTGAIGIVEADDRLDSVADAVGALEAAEAQWRAASKEARNGFDSCISAICGRHKESIDKACAGRKLSNKYAKMYESFQQACGK